MILGITGTDGAGKGTVVDYLVEHHGYRHYSARSFILKYVAAEGLEATRNQLRLTANILREKYGDDYVVKQAYEDAQKDGATNVIIESIRAVAEVNYLKTHGGILLAVDADQTLRFKRVQERRGTTDQIDFATFAAHELLESNDPNPHGMQKAKVMETADYTIQNNGSLEELHSQIEAVLAQFQTH
jgi:dephospho-CoA kinase